MVFGLKSIWKSISLLSFLVWLWMVLLWIYLLEFEYHLKGYANLVEFELRAKFPAPSENESFVEQVRYLNMIQQMVDEFVMEEVKLV